MNSTFTSVDSRSISKIKRPTICKNYNKVSGCTSGRNAIWCDTIIRFKQKNQIDKVLFDINKLSDLTSRKSNQFSDVEIFEKELAQGVFIAMLRGGFTAANPKLYMDNVVSEYVGQSMYNEFVEIEVFG